jgi:hypothetical protein
MLTHRNKKSVNYIGLHKILAVLEENEIDAQVVSIEHLEPNVKSGEDSTEEGDGGHTTRDLISCRKE